MLHENMNFRGAKTRLAAILFLTLLIRTASGVGPTCVTPPAGLIGWWPGEGNANDIGGNDSGTLQGGVSASVAGVVGTAFSFDGTSGYVQIPDSPQLRPANLTIEAWVRFSSLDSTGSGGSPPGEQYLVFKQNSRNGDFEGFDLGKSRVSGGDVFCFMVSSASGQGIVVNSTTFVSPNVWYHVAAVRGSNTAQLYVNGHLEGQTSVSFSQDYGNFPLYFGTSGQSYWDHKFSGLLDEVSLYNRALSASEIAAEYNAGNAGKCKVPRILTQPQGGKRYWGDNITLAPTTAGVFPMIYQWEKDGLPIPGATKASLVLTNLQVTNSGAYLLWVTNVFGSATSDVAVLNVTVADLRIAISNAASQKLPALTICGLAGQVYRIQSSADPGVSQGWTSLNDLTLTSGTNVWFDSVSAADRQRFYRVIPGPPQIGRPPTWENADIGAVWSDDFNRDSLGANWVVLGGANASVTGNELLLNESNLNYSRQIYYDPWLTSSDSWSIRWSQRFAALNASSYGVGVGIKNFQAYGGDDRGYNGFLSGAGSDLGKMEIKRFDGGQQVLASSGPAIGMAAGDVVDCSLSRSGWTVTATASNRANAQVSTTSIVFRDAANLIAPTISRICIYSLQGTVYLDDISFTINHRKPARFIVMGASTSDGYNASDYSKIYVSIIQSNFTERVCNNSSSYNTTADGLSVLPEVLAHHPGTAIIMIGGNDLLFGVPASQWQSNYSNLAGTLQANGVKVKHCLPPPRSGLDLRPLKTWLLATYPTSDIIDTWTPMLQGTYSLNPAYDSGDGTHPNDAGHQVLGQTILSNLQ
jgi:lysophospholipase L1-like esterase